MDLWLESLDLSRHLVQGIEGNVEMYPRAVGLLAKVFWTTSECKNLEGIYTNHIPYINTVMAMKIHLQLIQSMLRHSPIYPKRVKHQ